MKFQVLGSGSKGNCTFVKTETKNILIDCGLSIKDISSRSDIIIYDIDIILITHEHIDHVKYIESIARKTNAVIYVNEKSFYKIASKYIKDMNSLKVKFIEPNKIIKIDEFKILPINLQHDTESCYGYIISEDSKSLGYCTDTGFIPLPYMDVLKKLDSIIIEANHDVEMLMHSNRPWHLKQRILSVKGHMSNKICGEILNKLLTENVLSKIVLAHLSEECNDEETAIDTVLENIEVEKLPEIYVAKQWEALPMLEV